MLLLFGAYDLNDLFQTGALSSSPAEIFIHPDWNPFNQRYDADIAALVVEDDIPYTKYIRPICLPAAEQSAKEGYVTGWGESEDNTKVHENIPKQIKIPIHANEKCFLESGEFAKISSLRTFCGGARDNIGPCRGDSGGGLFVKTGNVFLLKGIVSASLINLGQCDVTNFAIYTNVDKFIDWIQNPTEELLSAGQPAPQSQSSYNKPAYTPPAYTTPAYTVPSYVQRPGTTRAPISYRPQRPEPDSSTTCGVMSLPRSLIQGGAPVSRELFPWTVAILQKQSFNSYVYFSTGTLISAKHIVSTGLSFATLDGATQQYVARKPSEFRMHFGINNLDVITNADQSLISGSSLVDGVSQVILHPRIKHGFPRIANIGVLVLRNPVQFNNYISAACLPDSTIDAKVLQGLNAVAVGWGQDDSGSDSTVKKFAAVRLRTPVDCEYYWSEYLLRRESSTFFCAGGDGRKSACYRDQPLYLKTDGKWILRGLISIAMNQADGKCDLDKPVLYEDVGQYNDWLKSLIS